MLCRDIWCLLKLSVTKILLSMRIVFPAYVYYVYYVSYYTVEEELYSRHRRIKKKRGNDAQIFKCILYSICKNI